MGYKIKNRAAPDRTERSAYLVLSLLSVQYNEKKKNSKNDLRWLHEMKPLDLFGHLGYHIIPHSFNIYVFVNGSHRQSSHFILYYIFFFISF